MLGPKAYEDLRSWAKTKSLLRDDEYEAFRAAFFMHSDNLPQRAYEFVGRHDDLNAINHSLLNRKHVNFAVALHGAGGQGKTSLAREYARLYEDSYSAKIWVDAHSGVEKTLSEFAVRKINADQSKRKEKRNAQRKLNADAKGQLQINNICEELVLAYRGRILIVIDDVPSHTDKDPMVIRTFQAIKHLLNLPVHLARRFHLLFTSRYNLIQPNDKTLNDKNVKTMAITRLSKEDAIRLFRKRANFPPEKEGPEKLEKLVDEVLGGHPLAITLLAAYAQRESIWDVEELERRLNGRIVDADLLQGTPLQEYPRSLYASFKLAFNQLSLEAKLLLMWLSMFRREAIDVVTLKKCAHQMKPQTREVEALVNTLNKQGGPSTIPRELVHSAIAEQIASTSSRTRGKVTRLQLHEVIYDFAHVEWAKWDRDESDRLSRIHLRDLELSATRGAIAFLSDELQNDIAQFSDIAPLSGMLIPEVQEERQIIPNAERIDASLEFWYDHFIFQNFVYDTGIQEALLPRIVALRDYLKANSRLDQRFELVLSKLIGHGYYGNPADTGELAENAFRRALVAAETLDNASPEEEGQIATARWYRIFLLDHRSNIASRKRGDATALPIRNDPQFVRDFDEIESALPPSLKELRVIPSDEQCELLLRAAHYWGHRGNQDSWIQYQMLLNGTLRQGGDPITDQSREHYIRAANYRMIALRIFRSGQFNHPVNQLIGLVQHDKIPFLVDWLPACPSIEAGRRYENFTTLSQGIGDTAHQYRGLFFVFAVDFFAALGSGDVVGRLKQARRILGCARELWKIAGRVRKEDEAPLRYRLSMNSSEAILALMENLAGGKSPQPLDELRTTVCNANKQMQNEMRTTYQYMADEQVKQVETIWKFLTQKRV